MTSEEFVTQIRKTVLEENTLTYRNLLESTSANDASDTYWKDSLRLYQSLSEHDRDVLVQIMRQVAVDTISNVFAVLDGVTWLEGQEHAFRLSDGSERLNGDLQDLFLRMEEGES